MIEKNTTLYKLMVLFMLERVDAPMTSVQFSNFILENNYTDYFTLQLSLTELEESGLVKTEHVINRTLYSITDAGLNTLEYYNDRISAEIKLEMMDFLKVNKIAIKEEVSVIADYFANNNDGYTTRCQIRDKNIPIIDLSINVNTVEQAEAICLRWNEKHYDVYEYLMDMLMN